MTAPTAPSSIALTLYGPPQINCRYDSTSSPKGFLEKFLAKQYGWDDTMKFSTVQFHLDDAALAFFVKHKNGTARAQGVPKDKVVLDWTSLKKNLHNRFSGHETYESNEAKLRSIKWNLLSYESFFFSISNLLDKPKIDNPARRVSNYIRQLPPDLARQMALSSPLDDDDVFQQLKNVINN
jgi:hypothetical protein